MYYKITLNIESWMLDSDCALIKKKSLKYISCEFSVFEQAVCWSSFEILSMKSTFTSLNVENFTKCERNMFLCYKDQICIDLLSCCNKVVDCPGAEDESDCDYTMTFRCDSGERINTQLVCDYVNDCFDESDESNCRKSNNILCD